MKRLLLAVIALTFVLAGIAPAYGATPSPQHTDPSFFGMHVNSAPYGDFPSQSGIGAVRLWDTHTAWRDVETSRGVYDWTTLDTAVSTVRANGATAMLVLSGTPLWYAKDPTAPSAYGDGFCSPTNDLGAWRNYVTAVATRYKGVITAYEPVNEGDILAFYCGDKWTDLTSMARVAYKAIKAVDPSATVTSPSFVDRESVNQYDIVDYMKGGGWRWCDVVSYHPYGMPNYGPELNARLVQTLQTKLAALGIHKTIWSTEINYGLPFGNAKPQTAMILSPDEQAAYITRTYLMQRAVGVGRVYWYDWSDAQFLGVKMTSVTDDPARAFRTVRWWMHGRFVGCTKSLGVWTCTIKYRDGYGLIKWNPNGSSSVSLPRHTVAVYDMYGARLARHGMSVGSSPILFRTNA